MSRKRNKQSREDLSILLTGNLGGVLSVHWRDAFLNAMWHCDSTKPLDCHAVGFLTEFNEQEEYLTLAMARGANGENVGALALPLDWVSSAKVLK